MLFQKGNTYGRLGRTGNASGAASGAGSGDAKGAGSGTPKVSSDTHIGHADSDVTSGNHTNSGDASGAGSGSGDASRAASFDGAGNGKLFEFQEPESGDRGSGERGHVKPTGRPKGAKGKHKGKKRKQPIFRATDEGQRPTAQKIPIDLGSVEKLLLSVHWIAAELTRIPELNLDAGEAAKLAASVQGVMDQYEIQVAQRTLAWTDLVVTMGGIYGTRAYAYHLRTQAEGRRKGPQAVPINQAAQAGPGQS